MSWETVMRSLDTIATRLHNTPVGNAKDATTEQARQVHQSSTLAGINKYFKEGGLAQLRSDKDGVETGMVKRGDVQFEVVDLSQADLANSTYYSLGNEHWLAPNKAKSCIMFASTVFYGLVKECRVEHPVEIIHRPPTNTCVFEHYFVVVGRNPNTNVQDYRKWSSNTCVADIWLFNQEKIHVPFAPMSQIRDDAKGAEQAAGKKGHFRANMPGAFKKKLYKDRVVCRFNRNAPSL